MSPNVFDCQHIFLPRSRDQRHALWHYDMSSLPAPNHAADSAAGVGVGIA